MGAAAQEIHGGPGSPKAYDGAVPRRTARALAPGLLLALSMGCEGARSSPDPEPVDARGAPGQESGVSAGDATGDAGPVGVHDLGPRPAGDTGASGDGPHLTEAGLPLTEAGLPLTEAGLPLTEAGLPLTEAGLPLTEAGLPLTEAGLPLTDAGLPPPLGRVCCVADADCDAGRRCDGGRCWNPLPSPACDGGNPCPVGALCENGLCQPVCGCVEGSCPPNAACITDDQSCGVCVPDSTLCAPACDRDLANAAFAHLAPDPLMHARPLVFEGVLTEDARVPGGVGRRLVLVDPAGVEQAFLYVLPPGVALPFVLGEVVRADISGLQGERVDGHASLAGPEGVRLMVVQRRGGAPTEVLGLPFHIEDLGCGPTLIGNCLLAMPATLVFDVAGSRSPVAHTGDQLTLLGWRVEVARVYRDENACEPAIHDLYANFVLTRARP